MKLTYDNASIFLIGKDNQLFITHGKSYKIRLIRFITPFATVDDAHNFSIEYRIIDDVGTECWHSESSFYKTEEWREKQLEVLGI
jgi:hypothetical protein